ncbi:hypothetical protein D3C76_814650 [compost metagenome]
MRQHVQIVMRQLITEDICPVLSTQDTDTDRRRGHNFAVKLFVLFQSLGVIFRRNENLTLIHSRQRKQRNAHQHIQ